MKKIIYRNIDRFIEDTESFSIILEVDVYFPVRFALVVYRNFCKNWSVLRETGGNAYRYAWFELYLG